MIKYSNIKMPPEHTINDITAFIGKKLRTSQPDPSRLKIIKKSVDARHKDDIHFVYTVAFACENENAVLKKNSGNKNISSYKEIPYSLPQRAKLSKRPVVVGFGPAGMFAALYLAQCGVRPIVLERGLDVDSRKEKVKIFWEKGILDTECNVQFGFDEIIFAVGFGDDFPRLYAIRLLVGIFTIIVYRSEIRRDTLHCFVLEF